MMSKQTLFRILFWTGYTAMFITALLPADGNLSGTKVAGVRMDYLLHFLMYLGICLYYFAGRKLRMDLFNRNSLMWFILVTFFLAMITEVVQLWVPGRSFNPFDWLANTGGLVIGVAVMLIFSPSPYTQ